MKKLIRIWDLPIRLFHWLLVACIVASFITVEIGGNAMEWHAILGYCILVLVVFRICWGFVGSHHARFVHFIPSPRRLFTYISGGSKASLGHNPLGALSVLALLTSIGLQAVTGLFANDDIAFEGPFAKYVSSGTVEFLTSLHHLNEKILIILIVLHLCAILYYQKFKGDNLIGPMILGDKEIDPSEESKYLTADLGHASKDRGLQRGLALLLLSLIAVILGYFITA
ncbi:cytochrome b/b6 domain-containing protein [Polynucleobacter sp. AP-Nino-20-G2]|uniref:cytochrome b/b6 domain-containing protein n=1 Tax=Polynucleobacter sp. AP-Nino-20-G2 TaxID=2576917 RepID=UPI001BFD52CC|nr:cytochrome b/b6 domain-containing protein [Polynucleobacter sp. AP-Nino-20-G2]QWE16162.1 cytochrome b/b6 domain-containing protein [Polynucleobacter sp. AP-Nino-20-G2]